MTSLKIFKILQDADADLTIINNGESGYVCHALDEENTTSVGTRKRRYSVH
jgi:hypothetical protein